VAIKGANIFLILLEPFSVSFGHYQCRSDRNTVPISPSGALTRVWAALSSTQRNKKKEQIREQGLLTFIMAYLASDYSLNNTRFIPVLSLKSQNDAGYTAVSHPKDIK
jgi:hypothetical protein